MAVAVGRPVWFSEAEAELQAAPRLTNVLNGAGNGTDGWAQALGRTLDPVGAVTVAFWLETWAGVRVPAAWATGPLELPAVADEVAPTRVTPATATLAPVPVRLEREGGAAGGPRPGGRRRPERRRRPPPRTARCRLRL